MADFFLIIQYAIIVLIWGVVLAALLAMFARILAFIRDKQVEWLERTERAKHPPASTGSYNPAQGSTYDSIPHRDAFDAKYQELMDDEVGY